MKTLCTYLAAFFLTLWVFLTALFSVGLNDENTTSRRCEAA